MSSFRFYIALLTIVCFGLSSKANNVTLEVGAFSSYGKDSVQVELLVSWENSWNESSSNRNHDAVWLFSKYRVGENWLHLPLDSIFSRDFDVTFSKSNSGCILTPVSGSVGSILLFLPRIGSELCFSGIEMVFVPEGEFYLGDKKSTHSFSSATGESLKITAEDELTKGTTINSLTPESISNNIPANYPKGYHAFYCMKYEVSQEQIVDFLNHLPRTEQIDFLGFTPKEGESALKTGANLNFNGIVVSEWSNSEPLVFSSDLNGNRVYNELEDGQTLACNFLSWVQLQSYLDWSGLRPMTEFEFEKASRGTEMAVEREFAFGTDKITDANELKNEFTPQESYTKELSEFTGVGAYGYLGRQGPLRCGFASGENTSRLSSGASYWGIMELSGNLWEQTYSVSKANGLQFKGTHGDGNLENGLPSDWKLNSSIVRGGAWNSGIFGEFRDLAVSDRYYYKLESEIGRNTTGGRGVVSLSHLK